MTENSLLSDTKFIRRRYAADRRFRLYGLAALVTATLFLALLIADIVTRSIPAFTQYHALLEVNIDPAKIDQSRISDGDFEGIMRSAWRAKFPSVTSRSDRALLNGLLSSSAADKLRKNVINDPSIIGQNIKVSAMFSDDADLYLKGKVTNVIRKEYSNKIDITFENENIKVAGENLRPGMIILADGGALKLSTDSLNDPVSVIVPPNTLNNFSIVSWREIAFDVAETERKISDRAAIFLEIFRDTGQIQREIAWNFFLNGDSREAEQAGILGSLLGSLMVVFITIILSLPIGVAAAIYLEQFAPKNRLTELIEVNINNLAAVPSIIFGLLGLAVFLGFFGMPRSVPLVGGIVIALMSLPTIIIASRAAIRAVPPSILEAALGVGASHQQGVFHHVLPLAMPGIMTGTILAVASAIGETAPLLLIGMVAFVVDVPSGFLSSSTVLPVQIYLWSDLPERAFEIRTAAAIIILLIIMLSLNAVAILLRNRFERRW